MLANVFDWNVFRVESGTLQFERTTPQTDSSPNLEPPSGAKTRDRSLAQAVCTKLPPGIDHSVFLPELL